MCDCDGNFIREERFWDIRESLVGDKNFEPSVTHEIFQAIDNKTVLRKNTESFEGRLFGKYYGKYAICETPEHQKYLVNCGNISEEMYCDLLEGSSFLTKQEEVKPKQKLKDRLFKHKA